MKQLSSCALFGATRALEGIKDAVVLQHSVAGCQWGSLSLRYVAEPCNVRQASSVIYEPDVTFGGMAQLERTISEAEKQFSDKNAFFVISGCVPNMIGDDVEAVLNKHRGSRTLAHVKAPGYSGSTDSGIEAAYLALLSLLPAEKPNLPVSELKSINLFGLMSDDPYLPQDLAALRQLLGAKVEINCCTAACTVADINNLPRADLNVVIGYGQKLSHRLQALYGQPWLEAHYPYGIVGAKRFLQSLTSALQTDFSAELTTLEAAAQRLAYRGADYLANLYGIPVAIAADRSHLSGLAYYLQEELGMLPVVQADTSDTDAGQLEKMIIRERPALLCGSSFLLPLAEKYHLPLLRAVYPVHDRVNLADVTYCGSRGSAFLLEAIVNGALQQSYKADGLYAALKKEQSHV